VPVTDTIHAMTDDAMVRETLDRSMLAAAQTPQCFRADILRDILVRAQLEQIEGTDEAGLAARFGYTVKAVAGDPRNLKITVPEDLVIAESYLQQWSKG
jgi:2-C-methyl-D-erythritol 4-phosphate cytidylyltransferase